MNSDEIKAAILESLKAIGVEMLAVHAGARKRGPRGDDWECDAWFITFKKTPGREAVDFDYYTGSGHRKVPKSVRKPYYITDQRGIAQWNKENAKPVRPSEADVLYSMLLDSEANEQSFNDWCSNFGYDTDSRKALDTYQACCDNAEKMYKIFSRAEINSLRELLQDY